MAESDLRHLKRLELRLLCCSLSPPDSAASPPPSAAHPPLSPILQSIVATVSSIEAGDFRGALASDAVRRLFPFAGSWEFRDDSPESAHLFYAEVEKSVELFMRGNAEASWLNVLGDGDGDDTEKSARALLVMCVGVAAFLSFMQSNMTGPPTAFPSVPIPVSALEGEKLVGCGGKAWELWAQKQLMSNGCHLLGKLSLLQYMVFANILLIKTKDLCFEMNCFSGVRTISWWLCRALFFHQRILDESSSSLFDLIQVVMRETVDQFGQLEKVSSYWGSEISHKDALEIVLMANLEAGIVEHKYGRLDSASTFLSHAEEACGVKISVTGVPGFRRVDQSIAHPQLVLVASHTNQSNYNGNGMKISDAHTSTSAICESVDVANSVEQTDSCDILLAPRLLEDSAEVIQNGGTANIILDCVQQVVALAHCLLLKEGARDDELQKWKMAPYIEAVDAQPFSYFMIKHFCKILRIRWEATRNRTKERAVLLMDKLVQSISEGFPGVAERVRFSYGVFVPTLPALRKEYGELLVSCGMMGEALNIFEDLELWDNLIYCYCLLEKKAAAVNLIKARLVDLPNDPRLWCSLGDATNDDSYYEKALEVSNGRSARAKRSLARSAYNRGDYQTSMTLWESAMAINSLYPDGWFALGAAAIKARNIDKAVDAFTFTVQLDPENGEAWNNIACLHKIQKKSKQAFIAFKEALKFRRNTWQMWENFSEVAMDVGNISQALEAVGMVLKLTDNKRVNSELLERLIVEMEQKVSGTSLSLFAATESSDYLSQNNPADSPPTSTGVLGFSEFGMASGRETEMLMELLGKVLQQIVRSGEGENIWGLYARWHRMKGDHLMCAEALLKQVRSYQGTDLWHNHDKFKKFAQASLQLCRVYMEIASSTGSSRELGQAEMHLRNTIKQAVAFTDTEEYRDLQSCYDEIKELLENSTGKA